MLKFPKISRLFCLIILWTTSFLSLQAQINNCLDFEELPAEAVFGINGGHAPGDLAFTSNGVNVYLQEFQYSTNETPGFWNANVSKDIFGPQTGLEGQSLFISNINLTFDFTSLNLPVNGVCFQIVDGGGEENIAVNGQDIVVLPDFWDAPQEIAPGVFLSVDPHPDTDGNFPSSAQVCLRGKIETLTIGGQEFALDNLCYYSEPCTLSDLKAEIVNCDYVNDEVYVYEVEVNFSLLSSANTNFDVFINGDFRGFYSVADLPLRLKQVRVLSSTDAFDIKVCVNDRPDCCTSIQLPNAGCPTDCKLEAVSIAAIECNFEYYFAKINTKGSNLSGSITITNEFGETWTGPADGSEWVKFPTPPQNYDKWQVCDSQNPDCCRTIDFEVPCPTCKFGPLQVKPLECNEDGQYFFQLDFDHVGYSDEFSVFVGDIAFAFKYEELPVRVGPFPGNGEGLKILVLDGSGQCEAETYLDPVVCPPYTCDIGPLQISEPECTASGQFFFKLDFEHANTSEKFLVAINGEAYKTFAYADLPVRVGPLAGDGSIDWHVIVEDAEGLCAEETKFEAVNCQPTDCEIGPLEVSGPHCTPNGIFYFKLDFEYKNTSERFQVILNGEVFESYAYDDLPVRVGPLPVDGTTDWSLVVKDQFGDCGNETKFEAVDCQPLECEIGDLDISGPICIAGSPEFYFRLDFKYWNTSDQFVLLVNGEPYETYSYADLPIKVGPFAADATQIEWKIGVIDVSEKCDQSGVLTGPICNPNQCEIGDLDISGPVCLDDGQFYFKLNFKHWNTSEKFQVVLNGAVFESYAYEDLPVRVGPLPADGTTDWLIGVQDAAFNCGQEAKLPAVKCFPDECGIGNLILSEPICTDAAGQFLFKLDFEHKNTSETFKLFLNGELYGQFQYSALPVTVGPLLADGKTDWKILVEDQSGLCAEDAYLEAVDCNPNECFIGDLYISERTCTDDGQFYFELDFKHENTSEKFLLFLNDDLYESYAYADLPIKVGPLPANTDVDWHLLVRDAATDNANYCAAETKFPSVSCPGECRIGELHLSDPICSQDGQFYVELNFEYKNTSEKFQVLLNGQVYETYNYADLPVKVGPLPGVADKPWHILVRDLNFLNVFPPCASDAELPAVNCPAFCEIGELKISEPECTDDGQFYFALNFEHVNTSEKFRLYLNEELYETYAYDDLPVTVGPLPANTDKDWHILVRDLGDPNFPTVVECASDGKLGAVNCPGGECKIGGLQLSNAHCTDDGQQFYIQLDFDHENTSEKFQLYLNQDLYGTFSYEELPLQLGPFNALIDIEWHLLVKDASGDCAEDISFSAPNCGGNEECNLNNLQIERYPCIGGQFLVDLFFDIKNPGPQGYYVFTNGKISGPHSYDQPYITLGPFPGDGTTTYDFLVIDIEDPSCFGYYELDPVDCSNPCSISNVIAEAHECNADGEFYVDIAFDYDKVGGSGFTIRGNGVEYGKFEYGEPFYTVGPLKGDGTTIYEFEVRDNENDDCRDFTTIEPIDCLPCRIGDLEYTVQCLNSAKQFILNLDFEVQDPDSDRFILALGDEVIGTYLYEELPLSLELDIPETGNLIVVVWDAENQECTKKAQFFIPCCYLSDPIVEARPCENDGELWVDLDLKYHNVSESFQLVFGPIGGDQRVATFNYTDLPLTLGPLSGQVENWSFEVTDLGFYCQSSVEIETEYCDDDACAGWDETPLGAYGPLTGYDPGDEIDEEDDIRISFAHTNQPDCNCAVFIMKASTFPAFSEANGNVVVLDNSGALISAPGYDLFSLSVDYYYTGNEVLLKINGEDVVAAGNPGNFPTDIAEGVTLDVFPKTNDGSRGSMVFTGKINRITFMSLGQWTLDNFCTDKAEKEDEVWPGDTNLDNVANHVDLLNIGLGFGKEGPARTNVDNISWQAQPAVDWPDLFFDNDLNLKHADANGDGIINRTDREPILENYGQTHGPLPVFAEAPATDSDPPLYVDFEASTNPIPVGGTFNVPIIFGTENLPVKDIYGLAFSILFDPNVIKPASIEVVYPDSWLGDTDNNLITLDRTQGEEGRIDIAITRIDKNNVGGFGSIASLIGAIDDIAGKHTEVSITEVVAITATEDRIPVNSIATKVEFSEKIKPDIGYIDLNKSLNIFPNPTSDEVLITSDFNHPIERIRILDSYGNPTGIQEVGKNRISLKSLPSGIYMMRIQLGKYTISRKIIKVN